MVWIGPPISAFVIIWDILWIRLKEHNLFLKNDTNIVNHQYIKHFHASKVSIAALTAICGIIDGIGGIFNHDKIVIGIIVGIYGAFCCVTGLITLWKLRHHKDFTIRKIVGAPCALWDLTENEYRTIDEPKDDPHTA